LLSSMYRVSLYLLRNLTSVLPSSACERKGRPLQFGFIVR
jgi:hypothetical protein